MRRKLGTQYYYNLLGDSFSPAKGINCAFQINASSSCDDVALLPVGRKQQPCRRAPLRVQLRRLVVPLRALRAQSGACIRCLQFIFAHCAEMNTQDANKIQFVNIYTSYAIYARCLLHALVPNWVARRGQSALLCLHLGHEISAMPVNPTALIRPMPAEALCPVARRLRLEDRSLLRQII